MKILLIGANGFLGRKAFELLKKDNEVIGTSRTNTEYLLKLDITKEEDIKQFIEKHKPNLVFNCAVEIDLDICEKEIIHSWNINTNGPIYLADVCKKNNIKLINISSDYIFSGKEPEYYENTPLDPISFYGITKKAMEEAVMYIYPESIIIRTGILYGYSDADKLVLPILKSLKDKKEIVVKDFRPKNPVLLDDFINNAIYLAKNKYSGIFHFATKETITRYDMARFVAEVFNLDKNLIIKGEPIKDFKNKPYKVKLINTRAPSLKFNSFEEGVKIIRSQMDKI